MQLLVTLSTKRGRFTSTFFKPTNRACLIVNMPDHSVQDLRDSNNACGLALPVAKWLDAVRLEDSDFVPDTWDRLLNEFACYIGDANTHGIIWDREDECLEFTMVFSNLHFPTGGRVRSLEELNSLTKDHTLSPDWA